MRTELTFESHRLLATLALAKDTQRNPMASATTGVQNAESAEQITQLRMHRADAPITYTFHSPIPSQCWSSNCLYNCNVAFRKGLRRFADVLAVPLHSLP